MPQKSKEISWTAPEFIHYPKSRGWFVAVLAVGVGLTIYFLFQKDFLASTLFALLTVLVLFFSRQSPRSIKVTIDGKGVKLGQLQLPYRQIKSFWIVYEPPEIKTLNLQTTAYLNRYLTIQLDRQNPLPLRELLLDYIPEDLERGEDLSDSLTRKMKF